MTNQILAQTSKPLSMELFSLIESLDNEELWYSAVARLSQSRRKQMLKKKLTEKVQHGDWNEAYNIAKNRLGRSLTAKEMETMFERDLSVKGFSGRHGQMVSLMPLKRQARWYNRYLKKYLQEKGNIGGAVNAARGLGRVLSEEELEQLLSVQDSDHDRHRVIMMFPEDKRPKKLRELFSENLRLGDVGDCLDIANDLGRKLTKAEAEKLLGKSLRVGSLSGAQKVKGIMQKLFTVKELELLLKVQQKKAWFREAAETIKLFQEPRRTREFKKLLNGRVEKGEYQTAKDIAEAMGRKLNAVELERIFKFHKAKTHHRDSSLRFLAEQLLVATGASPIPQPSRYSGPGA